MDVCARAVTGSGKTAAFVLPILQRISATRQPHITYASMQVLILEPTRELAMQCLSVVQSLGKYTTLTSTVYVLELAALTLLKY